MDEQVIFLIYFNEDKQFFCLTVFTFLFNGSLEFYIQFVCVCLFVNG